MNTSNRKLTIRMPAGKRWKSAEIGDLHLEPGNRVSAGDAVMTLKIGRKHHLVRAPRPGRAVPLVTPGDRIKPGEPLFVLNIDAKAMEEIERERRLPVPLEHLEWSPQDAGEDPIRPVMRNRRAPRWMAELTERLAQPWGRPVLAVGLYGVACLAVFPVMSLLTRGSGWVSLSLLAGLAVASGILLYRLLAPRHRLWPRRVVGLVSASWIGVAMLALFGQPEPERPVPGADRALAGLVAPSEQGNTASGVALATGQGSQARATGSGVLAQLDLGLAPVQAPPPAGMADAVGTPAPLGVRIRPGVWREPERASGRVLAGAEPEPRLELPRRPMLPERATPATLAPPEAGRFAAARVPERVDTASVWRAIAAPDLQRPAVPEAPRVQSLSAAPGRAAVSADSAPVPSPARVVAPESAPNPTVAILLGAGAAPEGAGAGVASPDTASVSPERPAVPDDLRGAPRQPRPRIPAPDADGREPDVIDPTTTIAVLATPLGAETGLRPPSPPHRGPALRAPVLSVPHLGQPRPRIPLPDAGEREPDPVLAVVPAVDLAAFVPPRPAGLSVAGPGQQPVLRPGAGVAVPAGAPARPAALPEPGPEPDLAQRLLVFLYFADPRLSAHPGVGDPWMPALPEPLASRVLEARVEDVAPIVQVAAWCGAAGGGQGVEALLNDRIRLMQVRLTLPPEDVPALETALPVFGSQPPGFFHNRHPLMGGAPSTPVLSRARAYLEGQNGGAMDPNSPDELRGGLYYADPAAAARDLMRFGCRRAVWNGGTGAETATAREVDAALRG